MASHRTGRATFSSSGASFSGVGTRQPLEIGVMPLVDAAPIIVAERLGFFAEQGLNVRLCRERTWAAVRDKLIAGVLDAAPVLAPMPLASMLALDGIGVPLVSAMVCSRNGNAITLSNELHARLAPLVSVPTPIEWARAAAREISARRRAGALPLVLAHVFPSSSHALQLRYWLAAAGVDVVRDVQFVVVPPSNMAEQLAGGRIDGFCVGAPWGAVSAADGVGHVVVQCSDIWPDSPEKVLGVTEAWARDNDQAHVALVRALLDATHWLGDAANLDAAVRLLVADGYLDVPAPLLRSALPCIRFDGGDAQRPWVSEMHWLATQLQRWAGSAAAALRWEDLGAAASAVCASDVFERAAQASGIPVSSDSLRMEGPWFDGVRFDPWLSQASAPR